MPLAWDGLAVELDRSGWAVTAAPVLTSGECGGLVAAFDDHSLFRSTVDMARHRFGEGTYRYFRYPLPAPVASLRTAAYPALAAVANAWAERLGDAVRYPPDLEGFLERCRRAGQNRPTPLLLRYEAGGWNALHQDLYGEVAFPFQLTVALTRPGVDFEGGENLFVEQRPRSQSRGTSLVVPFGHGVVFPTRYRAAAGRRGWSRTVFRHGVSTVTRGTRVALGVIFHEAA